MHGSRLGTELCKVPIDSEQNWEQIWFSISACMSEDSRRFHLHELPESCRALAGHIASWTYVGADIGVIRAYLHNPLGSHREHNRRMRIMHGNTSGSLSRGLQVLQRLVGDDDPHNGLGGIRLDGDDDWHSALASPRPLQNGP